MDPQQSAMPVAGRNDTQVRTPKGFAAAHINMGRTYRPTMPAGSIELNHDNFNHHNANANRIIVRPIHRVRLDNPYRVGTRERVGSRVARQKGRATLGCAAERLQRSTSWPVVR